MINDYTYISLICFGSPLILKMENSSTNPVLFSTPPRTTVSCCQNKNKKIPRVRVRFLKDTQKNEIGRKNNSLSRNSHFNFFFSQGKKIMGRHFQQKSF